MAKYLLVLTCKSVSSQLSWNEVILLFVLDQKWKKEEDSKS